MKSLAAIILGLFCISASYSQNPVIDSLESVITNQVEDTAKVNSLINLAFEWRFIDAIKTIKISREAMFLARELGFSKGETQSMRNLGLGYSYIGKLDSALLFVKNAKSLAEQNGFLQLKADALNTIGNIHFRRSQYDSARKAFKDSYLIFNKLGNQESKSISLASIAITYSEQGKYSRALEMYQQALLFFEKKGNANMLANMYNNIANVYLERDDFEKAFEFYSKTSEYDSITGNKSGRAHTLLNVGNVLVHLDRLKEAKSSYRLAISLAYSSGSACIASLPMSQLGDIYLDEKEFDSAYHYISRALEIAQGCSNDRSLASVYRDFGEYYSLKGNLVKAESMLLEGYRVADRSSIVPKMAELAQGLQAIYEQKKQYKKAFEFLKIAHDLQNEQFNEKSTKEIARLEAEYEFEKEKQIIAEEQKRKELAFEQELIRERWLLISAVVVIVLVSIIALFAYRSFRIKQAANLQLEEKNRRLAELRANEKRLSEEAIASKERELATMAMASHEKNTLLSDLEQKVSFIEARIGDEMKTSLKEMKKAISDGYSLDKSWDSFLHRFEDVHPQFFDKLKDENPVLTVDDLKLSAYLKIGMSNKEIANVTHLTLGSVKSKINRLKKKLEMGPDDSLRDYMLKYA